jgi:O-antigen biosynthesis protein WbqP
MASQWAEAGRPAAFARVAGEAVAGPFAPATRTEPLRAPARVRSRRSKFRRDLSLVAKRLFDLSAACAGIVLLSWLMALIWVLVVTTSKGPAIFWSTRVGRHGQLFRMPKFRTLRVGVSVEPRESLKIVELDFTPVGKVLRRSGFDELPQLFSVLSGDMSVIGPRPLLVGDPGARERTKFPRALSLRPGMSGLAQVNGRNQISPRRKARLDALYARTVSLRGDLALVVKTVQVIVSGKGFV